MSDDKKGWLHSDIYDRAESAANRLPRISIFKFGSFGDLLRSAGKLIAQSLMWWFLFIFLLIFLFDPAMRNNDQYFATASEIIDLICSTVSIFLAVKILEDTNVQDIGLRINRLALYDFLAGLGIVFIVFAFEFLLDVGSGAIEIQNVIWRTQPIPTVLFNSIATFLIFAFVGWCEELLSRGYHMRILSEGLNGPLGIILSSAVFSYLHHNNPGMTAASYFFIFLFGLIMAAAFLRSGNLWLGMGLHAAWDFFSTMFWGFPVNGLRIFHLVDVRIVPGVALWGAPRAILELVPITFLVYFYTRRRRPEFNDW